MKLQTTFGEQIVAVFWLTRVLPVALLFPSSATDGLASEDTVPSKQITLAPGIGGTGNSASFIFLAEEAPLVPGRPNRVTTYRIEEGGATQTTEIIDDEIAGFDEGKVDAKKIFTLLASIIGKQFVVHKRSATAQTDGLYPSFLRVFFRYNGEETALYADLAQAVPAPLAGLIEQIHSVAWAPAHQPPQKVFLQSALLDRETVAEFRRDHLLRSIAPNELKDASLTAATLRQPFKLIGTTEEAIRHDSLASLLTTEQPVFDIQYGNSAFQLRLLKPRD